MDSSLKQRLVGIAVIFALAVIFLPMILDGSGIKDRKLVVDIPQPPVVIGTPKFKEKILELEQRAEAIPDLEARYTDEQTPVIVSQEVSVVSADQESEDQPEPEKKTIETQAIASAEKNADSNDVRTGGESWVLQVASFTDRQKAVKQRDKLKKSKVAAVFIENFKSDSTVSYRVRLGPFLTRDEANVAQNKIKAKHNIDGLVMKYER